MNPREMTDEQYGLFFSVRRSIRYHDRRRAFFERMHQVTGALTVLLAGSVLFDIARLTIEQDEPPIYRALDLLCHNELLRAEGFGQGGADSHYEEVGLIQRVTRHLIHWPDLQLSSS